MPVVRTQRVFIKNLEGESFVQHVFGSEFSLMPDEDSMEIALLQVTIPPMALHLLVYYTVGGNNFIAEIPIELKIYSSINDLKTEVNDQFAAYQVPGFLTLDNYITASTSGQKIKFSSTLAAPVYVYQIEIQSSTSAALFGFTQGIHAFPGVAPNDITGTSDVDLDAANQPTMYIHTDLNSTFKNLDNLKTQDYFDKTDIFAKVPYENAAGGQYTFFYDSTKGYFLNIKTNTLSSLNFFITDLSRALLHPQKDWGMVLELVFRKKPDYESVITNKLLTEVRDYLRNMWLSTPPSTMRKQLG